MASKVFHVDMRSLGPQQSIEKKLASLFSASGAADTFSHGDVVAVKTHFGQPGNHRLLRPQHIRAIVEKILEAGGRPFVTDTTGIGLASSRGTAEKCLKAAAENGYTRETVGAPLVVADGMKGLSGVRLNVNGLRMKEVEVAQAIAEADALFSLAHVKGHPRTGLGGTLKNVGVGCVTKCGRAPLHLARKPRIDAAKCDSCGKCVSFCPPGAIIVSAQKPVVDEAKCIWGCGCQDVCPQGAISGWQEMHHEKNAELCVRVADATAAVVEHLGKDRVMFFNFGYDITPHCDCAAYGDTPIVPDIGILASKDPVAVDKASIDMITASPGMPNSACSDVGAMQSGVDKLSALIDYAPFKPFRRHGGPDWRSMLDAAVELGLGSTDYELIHVQTSQE